MSNGVSGGLFNPRFAVVRAKGENRAMLGERLRPLQRPDAFGWLAQCTWLQGSLSWLSSLATWVGGDDT